LPRSCGCCLLDNSIARYLAPRYPRALFTLFRNLLETLRSFDLSLCLSYIRILYFFLIASKDTKNGAFDGVRLNVTARFLLLQSGFDDAKWKLASSRNCPSRSDTRNAQGPTLSREIVQSNEKRSTCSRFSARSQSRDGPASVARDAVAAPFCKGNASNWKVKPATRDSVRRSPERAE
jgi:hypothetical protein